MKSISTLSYDYRGITLMSRLYPYKYKEWFYIVRYKPLFFIYKKGTYLGFCYFTSDVIGLLIPFIETRKALAEPNFKLISRRTGIWLLSSVT